MLTRAKSTQCNSWTHLEEASLKLIFEVVPFSLSAMHVLRFYYTVMPLIESNLHPFCKKYICCTH